MQKRFIVWLIGIFIFLSFGSTYLFNHVTALESTIYVDDDNIQGPWDGTSQHPFQNIQDGINAASENDIVHVRNGTYNKTILINKTITLIGDDKSNTSIDGLGSNSVVNISADHVSVRDFTIKNGTYGILIYKGSNNSIIRNTIKETTYSIYLESSYNNSIFHNNFLNPLTNAYDNRSNLWDDGYPSGGNYWADYTGADEDEDGIGDTPYSIPGGSSQDRYPKVKPLTMNPSASFIFVPSNPTTQNAIEFTDTSIDLDGYITSWSWDFGDGTTSTQQHPSHNYTDDGFYNITLKVTDDYGVEAETWKQIHVLNVAPIGDYEYFPANPTDLQQIIFNDTSYDSDGEIVSWSWDFGDGNSSELQNSSHQYRDNGTYTVKLTVIDDDGARTNTIKQIIVYNVGPSINFVFLPANPTTNDTVRLIDSSDDKDGTIVAWFWDFGDETNSTEKAPTHNYKDIGNYIISLKVTDNDGASSSMTKQITILNVRESPVDEGESTLVYIGYLALFVIMIGIVVYIKNKYG